MITIKLAKKSDLGKLKLFDPRAAKEICIQLAAKYLTIQRDKIDGGLDPNDDQFAAYSTEYEENKSRAGRDVEFSWLNATGKMLRSQRIHASASSHEVKAWVGFDGSRPSNVFRSKRRRKQMIGPLAPGQHRKRAKAGGPLTIGMSSKRTVKNEDLARWNNETRPFIGLSVANAKLLIKMFVQKMREALKNAAKST